MATAEKEYARLPGRGSVGGWSSFFGISRTSCTLWLAADHLLQTELASGYLETSKRFYFRDIQALVLVKTKRWQLTNGLLGFLAGGILLMALLARGSGGGEVALLIVGGIVALIFLVNFAAGPTCRCHLRTAVHQQELPSLRRLRRARKVLAQLQPLIEQAQGALSREEVAARFQAILSQMNLSGAVAAGQPLVYVPVIKPYRSRMHRVLYGLLLLHTVVSVLNIFLPAISVVILAMAVQLGLLASLILALVKQDETDLKPALKSLTWVVGGYVALNYLAGYIVMLTLVTTHPAPNAQWGYIKSLAALKPLETPWYLWLLLVSGGVSLVLGAWGNLLLVKHRRDQPAAPAVETGPVQPPQI